MFVHFLGGVLMKGETVNLYKGRLLCFCFLLCHAECALRVLIQLPFFFVSLAFMERKVLNKIINEKIISLMLIAKYNKIQGL